MAPFPSPYDYVPPESLVLRLALRQFVSCNLGFPPPALSLWKFFLMISAPVSCDSPYSHVHLSNSWDNSMAHVLTSDLRFFILFTILLLVRMHWWLPSSWKGRLETRSHYSLIWGHYYYNPQIQHCSHYQSLSWPSTTTPHPTVAFSKY